MRVIERPITVHCQDSDKGIVIVKLFTDRISIDILYYPVGHYVLLRRATLLSQPENENFILVVTMLLFAQKQMIDSCV